MRSVSLGISLAAILTVLGINFATAQEQGGAYNPKLNEIADTTIIAEVDLLLEDAQKIVDNISKETKGSERATDFKHIRLMRLRLNKKSPEVRAFLESFRQYKTSLSSQLQQKQSAIRLGASGKTNAAFIDIEVDRLALDAKIFKSKADLLKPKLQAAELEAKISLQADIDKLEIQARQKEAEANAVRLRKTEIEDSDAFSQKEIDETRQTISQIDELLRNGQSRLRKLDEKLVELDELSGALLQTDILNINYTDRSTYIFAILVGAVIVGFFAIAIRSEKVRDAIFTGDSGIQFVTLFSLVIAIILFGVLKILEGKELAALLGGLSGYILGRGSNRTEGGSNRRTPPPDTPTPAEPQPNPG